MHPTFLPTSPHLLLQRLLNITRYTKGRKYYFTVSAGNKAGFGTERTPRIEYLPPYVK